MKDFVKNSKNKVRDNQYIELVDQIAFEIVVFLRTIKVTRNKEKQGHMKGMDYLAEIHAKASMPHDHQQYSDPLGYVKGFNTIFIYVNLRYPHLVICF